MGIPFVGSIGKKLIGTRNERMVKRYLKVVDTVNAMGPEIEPLTDQALRDRLEESRQRIEGGAKPADLIPDVFAIAREVMDRAVGIRNIFNPEHNFDPRKLSASAQQLYAKVKAEMDATPPREPEGDLLGSEGPVPSWQFLDIPIELYRAVRELYPESKPPFRAHPFDVQIIGAVVLYEGKIAEMKTGEGKTIVAPLATALAILEGKQVHVVTVNDYLVQRDRDWTFPFFRALGMTVGAIHPMHMQSAENKKKAYACNVVYGTTSEFGFDYLRDNMKLSVQEQVQKKRHFAIVDEVDSILIDEARTPLIISGPAHSHSPRYDLADKLAHHLLEKQKPWADADQKVQSCLVEVSSTEGDIRNARDKDRIPQLKEKLENARKKLPELEAERDKFVQYYEVEMDKKKAQLTHDGITEAQKQAGVGSFYVGDNIDLPHLLEQAIRAHTVYQRDRDYVVAPDDRGEMSVIIVDQNTGRKMIGRQWSDGLHQAVEAKEGVPIKQETQTMATITIQNFFKTYERLAGMTGTADTEATEFHEIYGLDVICIPTNVPVVRVDRNDFVYMAVKDKWDNIVDEIKAFHDVGRPVLVGTTSVEKSEKLSEMLTRKHTIKHEVLNAKQHDREAEIIAHAGELGAVTISTNMAGRGTDIKLGRFTPQQLIDHWKRRGICPRDVNADMPAPAIVAAVFRHMAPKEIGLSKPDVERMSDEDIRLALLRKWTNDKCWISEGKVANMSAEAMQNELDSSGGSLLHRLTTFSNIEEMGGLHVIGTERHEARRIDNQLRGRSGRQGDNGSSRFFLSLEDDLMKVFAGPTTLKLLSRMGMKEGDVIEHPMLTRAVEKAQRKVEERNYLMRKNILEYDEPMDVQRGVFYGIRQSVLEGREVKDLIFDYIDSSVQDAVRMYLDKNYVANCVVEWVREHMSVSIDPDRLRGKDREDLFRIIRINGKEEAAATIRVTLGEYMPQDVEPTEWDLKGLADWANSTFDAHLKLSEISGMSRSEMHKRIELAADAKIEKTDLSPLDQFLVSDYGPKELVKWAKSKFGAELNVDDFTRLENLDDAVDTVMQRAREAYREREITYPVDFAMDVTAAGFQQNPQVALDQFCKWVKARYDVDWNPQQLPTTNPRELRDLLVMQARKWDDDRIVRRADEVVKAGTTPEAMEAWFVANMHARLVPGDRERIEADPRAAAEEKIRAVLRAELSQFERWVLLQILDTSWKDHLYQMDQLRESIGLRSFSQRDPRIEFKRESARLFNEMQETVREKVTDLIFKGRLTPQIQQRPPGPDGAPHAAAAAQDGAPGAAAAQPQIGAQQQPQRPRVAEPAITAASAAMAESGTASQRRDLETADRAGSSSATATEHRKPQRQPVRTAPTIGRNEPCPCGSGKKYKQCCGKRG
jgi:preprotein translocase subunit SecA